MQKVETILVTGATGFVGQRLCQHLLGQGLSVIALGRQSQYPVHHPKLQYHNIDSLWDADILAHLKKAETVVHLAAKVHQMQKAPIEVYTNENSNLTEHLAQLSSQAGVKHFVFLSSIKVNGERTTQHPYREDSHPAPKDAYGMSKWLAEKALIKTATSQQIDWTIIRPPLVYGPEVKANFLKMIRWVDANYPLPLKAIRNQRSLIAIDNLVDLIHVCIVHPNAKNQLFCVSDPSSISTPELLAHLQTIRNGRTKLLYCPTSFLKLAAYCLGKKAMLARLTDSLVIDLSKAKAVLDWQPKLDTKQALVQYFSRQT